MKEEAIELIRKADLTSQSADTKYKEAETLIAEYTEKKHCIEKTINDRAERLSNEERDRLKRESIAFEDKIKAEYKKRTVSLKFLSLFGILFGGSVTVLSAATSERFITDATTALKHMWAYLTWIATSAVGVASWTWQQLNEVIHVQVLNHIVAALVATICFLLVIGVGYFLIGFCGFKGFQKCKWLLKDSITISVAIVTGVFFIYFANEITWQLNILLLWLIPNAAIFLIRLIIRFFQPDKFY